jgi:hypothetical protein
MHLDEASDVIAPVTDRKIVVRELEGVHVKGSVQVLVSVRPMCTTSGSVNVHRNLAGVKVPPKSTLPTDNHLRVVAGDMGELG